MSQGARIAGGIALVVGILFVGLRLPSRQPATWEATRAFVRDDVACRALREERATTSFVAPEDAAVTVAEVAERFDLELALVCRANQLPAADCGETTLAAGETLVLPLGRRPSEDALDAGAAPDAEARR